MVLSNEQYNTSGCVTSGKLFLAQSTLPCDDQIPFAHPRARSLPFLFSCLFSVYFLFISYLVLWLINHLPDKAVRQGVDLWDQDMCDLWGQRISCGQVPHMYMLPKHAVLCE